MLRPSQKLLCQVRWQALMQLHCSEGQVHISGCCCMCSYKTVRSTMAGMHLDGQHWLQLTEAPCSPASAGRLPDIPHLICKTTKVAAGPLA